MNQAHWHLVLNHLPIIIPMIGLLVLIGGFVFRSETVKRTSFFIFILGALCTIPAFATGEGAEEIVEDLAGVDERLIKIHEEAAETFAILSYILGGLSLVGLLGELETKVFFYAYCCPYYSFKPWHAVFCKTNRYNRRRNQAYRNKKW